MAASPLPPSVSLYEYLHSDYQPDMDYVDGFLEERNLGEHNHADLQSELITLFRNHRNEWKVRAVVEQRVQVSPTRFRVPDVCILSASWKREPIITAAPLLCIEILSLEDRFVRIQARCQDYFQLGTREVWIFDPDLRAAMVLRSDGSMRSQRTGLLTLEGTAIAIPLPGIFAVLDEE